MKFLAKPTPHKEAAAFIRSLPTVDRDTFDELLPEFKAAAFLITGIRAHDVLQDVQDIVATAKEGADWEAVRRRIEAAIEPHLGKQARMRSLMILRNATGRAAALGTAAHAVNHAAAFPYRKRLSIGDGRVRDSHRAMHGMVLPTNSPFWDAHTPPDAHNCRCTVVLITRAQAERLYAQEEADVRAGTMQEPERRLPTGALLRQTEGGVINRGAAEQYNLNKEPGAVAWNAHSLLMPIAAIKERYTPEVFAKFRAWAEGQEIEGKSLWTRLNEQRAGNAQAARKPAAAPLLLLPAKLPKPRTREQVRAAILAL